MTDLAPNEKYTNSAIRPGDPDPYPDKPVGEYITVVVSNDWVNDEYKLMVLKTPEKALTAYAGQFFHLLCPTPDGATHLKRLKLDRSGIAFNISVLILMIVVFRVRPPRPVSSAKRAASLWLRPRLALVCGRFAPWSPKPETRNP